MIVGIPDHKELSETAIGWLNLAWETTAQALNELHENSDYFDAEDTENPGKTASARAQTYWHAQRYKLNNATVLFQQSLELFLKARIAEVSPFLLIVGDPQSWPKPDFRRSNPFFEIRTLDAVHLCRAADTVCASRLPERFFQFYDRLRTTRNKIAHLNAGNVRIEASHVVPDILTGFKLLFPRASWVPKRVYNVH